MTLLLHHAAGLRARGLTDETIAAAGLYSETDSAKLGVTLGWRYPAKKLGAAVVIPYTEADKKNGYHRVRPDNPRLDRNGKKVKYESPKGQPNKVYLPPGVAHHLSDPQQELGITEGEFKAMACSQEILPTIGLVGVMGWKPKDHAKLLPSLEAVAWNGRPVFLLPDSDVSSNDNVKNAMAWLAKHLADRGAKVRMAMLPDGPPDEEGKPTKLGVDDWLALQSDRKAALRKLLDSAEQPPEVDTETIKHNAEHADPAKEAEAILKATERDGVYCLRSYRGEAIYWEGGKYSPTLSSLSGEYGLWAMLDKTACFITDARLSGKTDSAIVVERLLNISGEAAIDVPRKYLETLRSVKLPVRLVLFSNELPALTDSSGALSGRLIVLRLTQTFYGRENRRLTSELLEERQGILLWAIEGWRRLRERGYFVQPESGRELAEQMDEISSPVAMFVREYCRVDPALSIPVADLYNGWCWWCRQKGRKESGTEQIFGRNLSAAVASVRRSQPRSGGERYRAYEGIDLTPDVKREIEDKGVGGEF